MQRQILAAFDHQGVFVYQAFNPAIAEEALREGTFGKSFSLERMTWIKPSLGWMLYRSGYATKLNQERILKIKLTHQGFQTILAEGVPSSFNSSLFTSQADWEQSLQRSRVRYQWDPDRDLYLRKLERRALQLGICGSIVRDYINTWILTIEDITELAYAINCAIKQKQTVLPATPPETVYQVDLQIQKTLSMNE